MAIIIIIIIIFAKGLLYGVIHVIIVSNSFILYIYSMDSAKAQRRSCGIHIVNLSWIHKTTVSRDTAL